jgi:hypothetical protein
MAKDGVCEACLMVEAFKKNEPPAGAGSDAATPPQNGPAKAGA